jgi:uncharacterized protein (TIGR01568 family)
MVKKQQQQLGGLITSLFSSKEVLPCPSTSSSAASSSSSSLVWQWPSCGQQPRTLSFRQEQQTTMLKQAYKTMNSAYSVVDYSCFSNSAIDDSFSTASEASGQVDAFDEAEAEAVICALRSDRLFFEPADASSTSCIKQQAAASKKTKVALEDDQEEEHLHPCQQNQKVAFGGATAMSVESKNPFRDFRESMEAMVMSHGHGGVKDWRWLEEMLGWYLKANGKSTHGLIVGAFVDLLISLASNTSPESSSSVQECCSSSL